MSAYAPHLEETQPASDPSVDFFAITRQHPTEKSKKNRALRTSRTPSSRSAILREEGDRAACWAIVLGYVCMSYLLLYPFISTTGKLRLLATVSVVLIGAVSFRTWYVIRRGSGYSRMVFRIFGWTCAICSVPAMAHLGVFSPAPVAITMAIGFFGFSIDREHALYIPLAAIFSYTIIAGSITFGLIPDPGLFSSSHLSFSTKLTMFVLVPMILTSTLWLARLSRKTMLECVDRAAQAMELADRRQELLVEAKQDLEQALRAGSGKSGRYTNQNAGNYQLGPLVSQGAIGEIYRARHRRNTKPAAVKVLQAAALHRNNAVSRFMREGRIATSLTSPYIVKTHEIGQLSDDLPYMAMEWLDGEDLASRLRRDTTLPLVIACELVDHIGQGLACAHDSGIVHRDLKPSNIFWARSSANTPTSWKVLDFGVSKLLHADQTLTEEGLIGTPGYMAPEQARGHDADVRSDIFSFGAVIYRALTGRPPFAAPNLPQTLYRLAYVNPPCPMTAGHPMSRDIARVLATALAKAPEDRFQSARAFTDAFAAAAENRLPDAHRKHADALLAKNPWGADTSGRLESTIDV